MSDKSELIDTLCYYIEDMIQTKIEQMNNHYDDSSTLNEDRKEIKKTLNELFNAQNEG